MFGKRTYNYLEGVSMQWTRKKSDKTCRLLYSFKYSSQQNYAEDEFVNLPHNLEDMFSTVRLRECDEPLLTHDAAN